MINRYIVVMGCLAGLIMGGGAARPDAAGPAKMAASDEPALGGSAPLTEGIVVRLGIRVEPDTEQGRRGLRIIALKPQSLAERAGLEPGDLLLEINRVPLQIAQDIERAIASRQDRPQVISFMHHGYPGLVAIDLH